MASLSSNADGPLAALASVPGNGPHGRIGVLICGHGSRNRLAVGEFAALAQQLRQHLAPVPVEYGYLEFARPILRDGLDALRRQGVEHVLAVPAMLFAAGHAKNDIPSVLNTYAAETGLRIDYGRELGVDLKMIQAAGARIRASIEAADAHLRHSGGPPVLLHDTLLVVVGRGSSDPDANSNVAKVTRMLVEGFGFGWGETVYSGVTFPLVEPGLRQAVRLGYRRIVVFPYFLFSGVLVSRIRQHTQLVAADHPAVEFLQASYLGDHPLVLDTFKERVSEVLRGDTDMNCSLCKYRAQVLGFEQEVGAPQHSHHHHVEGLVESCQLCEAECTGACQADGIPLPGVGAAAEASHGEAHGGLHGHKPAQEHDHDPGHHHEHPHDHHHSHDDGGSGDGALDSGTLKGGALEGGGGDPARGKDEGSSQKQGPAQGHHHGRYPHADHPLGPRSLRPPVS